MAETNKVKEGQRQVVKYFTSAAPKWDQHYKGTDVLSRVFQRRREVILRMVSELPLTKDACVLEVGCGAGLTSVELARRGYTVQPVDLAKTMINLTLQHATQSNVFNKIFASIGDVQNLQFVNNTFDLVLAVGVLPYLHSALKAMKEMARVTKKHGYLIFTSDNYWRLDRFLDPDWSPLLKPLSEHAKEYRMPDYVYSIKEVRNLLNSAQLEECKVVTTGYGPFTFRSKKIPERAGVWINERLQQLAERDPKSLLSKLGSHHILLVRKP